MKRFDVNTLLITLVMALSGWTLKKVVDLGESTAVLKAKVERLEYTVYKSIN